MRSRNLRHTHLYSHKLISKSFAQCLQLSNYSQIECISIQNMDETNGLSINIEINISKDEDTSLNKFDKIINELNEADAVTFKTMKAVLLSNLSFDPSDLRLKIKQIDSNMMARQLSNHMIMNSDSNFESVVSPDGPKGTTDTGLFDTAAGLLEMPRIMSGSRDGNPESTTTMDTPQPATPVTVSGTGNMGHLKVAHPQIGMNNSASLDFGAINVTGDEQLALTQAAMNSWNDDDNDGHQEDEELEAMYEEEFAD